MAPFRCSRGLLAQLRGSGSARILFSSRSHPRVIFSLLNPLFARSLTTIKTDRLAPSGRNFSILHAKSLMKDLESENFNYTSGRFLVNNAYQLQERRRVFDIPGLLEIIAKAMHCKVEQITGFQKLGEGGFNRVFLVTLDTNFQLVARIPYPLLVPKAYAIASEVATMDFLRSKGLPIPEIYAYSFRADNEAGTEYVLMEYVKGIDLSQIWLSLKEDEIVLLVDQLAKIESTMMSIPFPAGGSIYYSKDLKELSGNEGIPIDELGEGTSIEKSRFCVGPDVSPPLWYGRREHLNVFRGPYKNAESVLVSGAKKELAYLEQFGAPRSPYKRIRREYYNYEKQPPSDHVKNLNRYLRLAPSLVPADDSLNTFCVRHPDLTEHNIRVSRDSGALRILSLLDWQYTTVLPLFLHASIPDFIQNEQDKVSRSMVQPKLPDDFDKLPEDDQEWESELLRRRLVYYHYNLSTATYNRMLFKGLVYPLNHFRRHIFIHSSAIWEGETIKLLYALINMVVDWGSFATDDTPCPIVFTEEEMDAAQKLYDDLEYADGGEKQLMDLIGYGEDTWVPTARYEAGKALGQELKRKTLEACEKQDYDAIKTNWPLDDLSEEELAEYK